MKTTALISLFALFSIATVGCSRSSAADPDNEVNRIEQIQNDPSIPAAVKEDVIRRIKEDKGK